MPRLFDSPALVIATHNAGKVREIAALLEGRVLQCIAAGDLGLPEPEETGDTFSANARIKAMAAALASGKPALADDSGLCVSALDGAPGIYSARWAGPTKDFSMAMRRVQDKLAGAQDDRAAFVCALCLAWPDGHCEAFEGRIEGRLSFPPRGLNGFGYDPIFIPEGQALTFGEMEPALKDSLSHRAKAFTALAQACFFKP